MECPHCMQDSTPDNCHMTMEVFQKTLEFAAWSKCWQYNISGGEPTGHPEFERFIEILESHLERNQVSAYGNPVFTIESNGEWIRDKYKTEAMKRILGYDKLRAFQICSFKGLYHNYDFIQKHRKQIESLSPWIRVITSGIISMQDLGRASSSGNPDIIKAIKENKHMPSCINTYLLGKQADDISEFSRALYPTQTCKPFVDWRGNVHAGESIFCPVHGNVMTDSFETIWQSIRKGVPCGRCYAYKNLVESTAPGLCMDGC